MDFKPKKWQIVTAVILIVMFLNPSLKDFREFTGDKDEGQRKMNFLICSVYKESSDYYIGFLLNFIPIN
jgi:hypothetical protein